MGPGYVFFPNPEKKTQKKIQRLHDWRGSYTVQTGEIHVPASKQRSFLWDSFCINIRKLIMGNNITTQLSCFITRIRLIYSKTHGFANIPALYVTVIPLCL